MDTSSRRTFLIRLASAAAAPMLAGARNILPVHGEQDDAAEDEAIFQRILQRAKAGGFATKPVGEIMGLIGTSFLGAPYIAHSIEAPGDEHLVVNLRAFDCETFLESMLACARCVKKGTGSFTDFRRELQRIRYRGGVINGYASRLHYFTDWIRDNEVKGIVHDVTGSLGGKPRTRTIDFMTTHRSAYAQFADSTAFNRVATVERDLSLRPRAVLERADVTRAQAHMQSGDLIALATSIEGLDVTHTGFVVVSGGNVRYLHAPLSGGSVTLSAGTLAEYIQRGSATLTGILVARPLEP